MRSKTAGIKRRERKNAYRQRSLVQFYQRHVKLPIVINDKGPHTRSASRPLRTQRRRVLRVAYLSRDVVGYSERVAIEIAHFAKQAENWRVCIAYLGEIGLEEIAQGQADGVILGHWDDQQMLSELANVRIPVVATPHFQQDSPFAQVIPDDYEVGAAAARFFLSRGFRNFAYYGMDGTNLVWPWEKLRRAGYIETLARHHLTPDIFDNTVADWWSFQNDQQQTALRNWIRKLPKPTALFACMDRFAYEAVRLARDATVLVPQDLAICGVDNIEWICMLAQPPLTSIPLNPHQIGREACRVLNDMMSGAPAPQQPLLVPPLPVVPRASTDVSAFADPDVATAHRFIHEHAHQPVHVQDIVNKLMVSRRSIEMRFRAQTGSTLQDAIWRAHVDRARRLLIYTAEPMWRVAAESGFRTEKTFNVMFRKIAGCTPSEYRRQGGMTATPK